MIDIDDVEIDFEKKFVGFRQGLINNDILKSVKHSKTLCVINKIDKAVGRKFPPTICEMKSQIEDIKEFVFISCKEQINIPDFISTLQKEVYFFKY